MSRYETLSILWPVYMTSNRAPDISGKTPSLRQNPFPHPSPGKRDYGHHSGEWHAAGCSLRLIIMRL